MTQLPDLSNYFFLPNLSRAKVMLPWIEQGEMILLWIEQGERDVSGCQGRGRQVNVC